MVNGVKFKIRSDHKPILTVLRPNRGNKTFSSRLTRWVNRKLTFEFEVIDVAERTLGMADYLYRHHTEIQGAAIKAETLWNERFTVNSVTSLNNILVKKEATSAATNEQRKPASKVNESNTVNRLKAAKSKQPIRTRDKLNSQESSKSHCSHSARKSKMDSMKSCCQQITAQTH